MSGHPASLDGREFHVRAGETLLDACRRSAIELTFSCCAGVCQTCVLKAESGEVPAPAQKGLPPELRARGYVLACQCVPQGPMVLRSPDPADRLVDAMLHGAQRAGPYIYLRFETARQLSCASGDRLMARAEDAGGKELALQVTAVAPEDCVIEALCDAGAEQAAIWLQADFGATLRVRGPLDAGAEDELGAPDPDPDLWQELGEGATVAAVLEAFYRQVYEDPRLSGFFEGVTMRRSIEKQFSFLKQLMTGERVYFGDRPRNAHHWMVISPELFDYRQDLMRAQLEAHGLTEAQVARWMRLEVHYRRDIVKSQPWPRRVNGVELPLEGYGKEVLGEATLCDHCGQPLSAGSEVHYHLRLGKVSCTDCAPA